MGLPTLSRRRMLKGAAAIAALPTVAISADAAIMAFGPELNRLVAEYEVAVEAFCRAERQVQSIATARGVSWDVVKEEMGFAAVDARLDGKTVALHEVIDQLAETPADSLDGLKFKARYAEHSDVLERSIIDDLLRMQRLA